MRLLPVSFKLAINCQRREADSPVLSIHRQHSGYRNGEDNHGCCLTRLEHVSFWLGLVCPLADANPPTPAPSRLSLAFTPFTYSAQPKFRTMFPDYSGPTAVDLPVMGEAPPPSASTVPTPSPSPAPPASSSPASPPDSAVPPPTGLVGGSAAEATGLGGAEAVDSSRIEKRSFWTRWRKELMWTLLVLLVSWMSMKVLGEA